LHSYILCGLQCSTLLLFFGSTEKKNRKAGKGKDEFFEELVKTKQDGGWQTGAASAMDEDGGPDAEAPAKPIASSRAGTLEVHFSWSLSLLV
jgi:hypothetical protein